VKKTILVALVCLMTMQGYTSASSEDDGNTTEAPEKSIMAKAGRALIMYVPNRIMDVLDIVRLRARVGIGVAAGVRVTRPLTFFAGGYEALYVGLPGPRLKHVPVKLLGVEEYVGLQASFADGTDKGDTGPGYSSTEIGFSVHPWIAGVDIGIDPVEVLDLAFGFLFIDCRGDDL